MNDKEQKKPRTIKRGDRICWRAVNGDCSGVVQEKLQGYNILVKLDNQKQVVVSCYSIKKLIGQNDQD